MWRHLCRRAVRMALLAAGLAVLSGTAMRAADSAASAYKPILPDDIFAKLVTEDAKTIQDALGKATGADKKKMESKAKSSALMIAVYAQGAMAKGGANAGAMGGLRDLALKVAKAISDDKAADAKKLAADLKPAGKADPAAKPAVAVHDAFDTDILMQQFKPERGGGLGLENALNKTKDKRAALTPAEVSQAALLSYRMAAIAQATEAMAPAKDMGKKTRAGWVQLSKEMEELSLAAAKEASAAKPDEKKVKTALKKVEANCTKCHDTYRD